MKTLIVLLLLSLASQLTAAPAPLPRRLPPGQPPALATMSWGNARYTVTFERDGTYSCRDERYRWVGVWSLSFGTGSLPGRRVLSIRETTYPIHPGSIWTGYSITLEPAGWSGSLQGSTCFELVARLP